jgi:hypothetical protein
MNKKGASAQDLIVMAGILLVFGLLFFIVKFASTSIIDEIVKIPAVNTSAEAMEVWDSVDTTTDRFDQLYFGIFIGFFITVIIVGWLVGGNPLFMVIYFLANILAVIASMIFANVWYNFTQSSVFGTTINSFPITNHIMTNLPIYLTIMGIMGIVVMFSKPFVKRGL